MTQRQEVWTLADYAAYQATGQEPEQRSGIPPVLLPIQAPTVAEGKPIYRSKTEARYAQMLETQRYKGAIKQWWYEPFSLRLARATFYRPDFLVCYAWDACPYDCPLVCIEVKGGFIRDDAIVKFKVAARAFPCFSFIMMQYKKGTFIEKVRL